MEDYLGKLVAVKKTSLVIEYQTKEYQLHYVTDRTPPPIFEKMVGCISVYSGNFSYFKKSDILGVVLPRYLPEWAEENLEELKTLLQKEN